MMNEHPNVAKFIQAISDYRATLRTPNMDEDEADWVRIDTCINIELTFLDGTTRKIYGYQDGGSYRIDHVTGWLLLQGPELYSNNQSTHRYRWNNYIDLRQVLEVRIEVPPPILGEDEYDEEPDLA